MLETMLDLYHLFIFVAGAVALATLATREQPGMLLASCTSVSGREL